MTPRRNTRLSAAPRRSPASTAAPLHYDEIRAQALAEFELSNLNVEAHVLGRRHRFEYDGKTVNVSLPTKREIDQSDKFQGDKREYGIQKGHRIGSRQEAHDPAPTDIYSVTIAVVRVDISEAFRIPAGAARPDGKHYQSMTKSEQKRVQIALDEYGKTARRAFQYWLRVLRWKSQYGLIGRLATENLDDRWDATLVDPKHGQSLGYGIVHVTARMLPGVTDSVWKAIRRAVKAGREPPVWCELIFEGETAKWNGNFSGASLYYAIACESYLRSFFLKKFPRKLNATVIERQLNVRPILEWYKHWEPERLKKSDWKTIHKLMDLRNRIAHEGTSMSISESLCQKFHQVSRSLVSW